MVSMERAHEKKDAANNGTNAAAFAATAAGSERALTTGTPSRTKSSRGGATAAGEPIIDDSLNLSRLSHFPSANLHGFNIQIDHIPGALLKLVQAIAKEEMNIISVEGSSPPTSDCISMYIVIDFSGTDKGPKDMLTVIERLPSIRSVQHVQPLSTGFLADTSHFPIRLGLGRARAFIVSDLFWQSFLNTGYDRMGMEPTKLFFFQAGVNLGKASARQVKEVLNLGEGEDIIRVLLHQGKALGWWEGKGEANLALSQLDLKLWHNWEGEYARKWGAGCHAVRGFWEGALSEILQKRVQVAELACISKRSEFCEFRLVRGLETLLGSSSAAAMAAGAGLLRFAGKSLLIQVNSSTNYESLFRSFALEYDKKGFHVLLFSWKGSPIYNALSTVPSVLFRTLTSNVSYPKMGSSPNEILIPVGDKPMLFDAIEKGLEDSFSSSSHNNNNGKFLMIFDSISDMIMSVGFEKTYETLKEILEMTTTGRKDEEKGEGDGKETTKTETTIAFILKEGAHDERVTSLVRGLFDEQLSFEVGGLRVTREPAGK